MNPTLKIILIILSIIVGGMILFAGFLYLVLRTTVKDVSQKEPFSQYINVPIIIKSTSELVWTKEVDLHTKTGYTLSAHQEFMFDEEDRKTVKNYKPGDTIYFHTAKKISNGSVGTSYHYFGRDTLSSGEVVEFEYHTISVSEFHNLSLVWKGRT